MQAFGAQIRRTRQRLALTLDDLAARTGISKPYLSLIETGNVPNPPSDEKLVKLEQALHLSAGQLVRQAHLLRTPQDVRDALTELARERGRLPPKPPGNSCADSSADLQADLHPAGREPLSGIVSKSARPGAGAVRREVPGDATATARTMRSGAAPAGKSRDGSPARSAGQSPSQSPAAAFGRSLDVAYLSGVLHEMADRAAGGPEPVKLHTVPVVNRVSAGYPKDFTDLAYPRGVADEFIGCPDIADPDAFAARVAGDSMSPKYHSGEVVIFSPALPIRSGDDVFARFDDGQTTFKQVFFEQTPAGEEFIRLVARNPAYSPRVVPREQISGLYRAKFRYQPLD